jgi:LacI family transcriptional regulator
VKKKRKVTQGDIAKKLKLSITTVSRALQNDPTINSDTRAQILQMAARLDYQPRHSRPPKSAEGELQGRPHKFVCVIIKVPVKQDAWAPDEVASGYLAGMSEVAASLNVSMVIQHFNDETVYELQDLPRTLPIVQDENLAGFILIHHFPGPIVELLCKSWPVVALVHDIPSADIDLVDMDNDMAVSQLLHTLIEQGHRKIGFMGHRPQLSWSQARLGAYLRGLFAAGLTIDPELIVGETDAELAFEKLADGVTAWVCSVDVVAYQLYRELLDMGIKIPEQMSITGFNAVQPLLDCPQITTARAPFKDMGAAALQRLMHRIESPATRPLKILHRCVIVPGLTVGPFKI